MKILIICLLLTIPFIAKADVIITLEEGYQIVLQEYADINEITIEEYTKNILKGWIEEQIKGEYINKIKNKTPKELKELFKEDK